MVKFADEDTVINSIKSFLEVNKNSSSYFTFVKRITDSVDNVDQGMAGRVFWTKSKLLFVNYIDTIDILKNVKSLCC